MIFGFALWQGMIFKSTPGIACSPYFDDPLLFRSHIIRSPFRALVSILWLNATSVSTHHVENLYADAHPWHQATSVLALSVFNPLPSHMFLEASRRYPPAPTFDLCSVLGCLSSGSETRIIRRSRSHIKLLGRIYGRNCSTFGTGNSTPSPILAPTDCSAARSCAREPHVSNSIWVAWWAAVGSRPVGARIGVHLGQVQSVDSQGPIHGEELHDHERDQVKQTTRQRPDRDFPISGLSFILFLSTTTMTTDLTTKKMGYVRLGSSGLKVFIFFVF